MIPYLALFAIASILYFLPNKKEPTIAYYIFIVLAIAIAGFRDMIGGFDVYHYANVFELGYYNSTFQPLFLGYYQILQFISTDRYFMFFTSSLLTIGTSFYFLRKLSVWFHFSIFIFFCKFYLLSFIYIRQEFALVFVLMSFYFLVKEKKSIALLIIVIAIFFHQSALIFLPFIFMGNFKFSNRSILILVSLVAFFSFSTMGTFLIVSFGEMVGSTRIIDHIHLAGEFNFFYFLEVLAILILVFMYKEKFYQSKTHTLYLNGLFCYGLLMIFATTKGTFVRLSWYYFMFICLTLPIVYKLIISAKLKKIYRNLIFVFFAFVFFKFMFMFDRGSLLPYKSVFQDYDRNGQWEFKEYRTRDSL